MEPRPPEAHHGGSHPIGWIVAMHLIALGYVSVAIYALADPAQTSFVLGKGAISSTTTTTTFTTSTTMTTTTPTTKPFRPATMPLTAIPSNCPIRKPKPKRHTHGTFGQLLSNLTCSFRKSRRKNSDGTDLLVVRVTAMTDPTSRNMVDFVFSKSNIVFAGVTAAVSQSGFAEVVVRDLRAKEGLQSAANVSMKARSHNGHSSIEGDPTTWSDYTSSIDCEVSDDHDGDATLDAKERGPASHFIEVLRLKQDASVAEADFLDGHNAGSYYGVGWHLTMAAIRHRTIPINRYCVEVLNVSLTGIVTNPLEGYDMDSPYADFFGCNAGHCICPGPDDRSLSRPPVNKIIMHCQCPHTQCSCSKHSWNQSHFYVGREEARLPFVLFRHELGNNDRTRFEDWPPPVDSDSVGYWYSFPEKGRCRPGQPLGQGCTWRRVASYSTVFTRDILDALRREVHTNKKWHIIPTDVMEHNVGLLKGLFNNLTIQPSPCGGLIH